MLKKDEDLMERIRPLLARRKGYSHRKMFGGGCFMINGNMCAGTWEGSLIVRLARDDHDATQKEPHTREFAPAGRVMKGWVRVMPAGIREDDELKNWVRRAAKYAASLPPK